MSLLIAVGAASAVSVADVPRFAYAVGAYDSTLSSFVVDPDSGDLTFTGFKKTGKFPAGVVAHPNGRFVYVCAQTGMTISAFAVDPRDGRLSEVKGSPYNSQLVSPAWLTFTPSGKFLYAAGRNSQQVMGYRVDSATGQLRPIAGGPIDGMGTMPRSLVVHPSGRFLYNVNITSTSIGAWRIDADSGRLTPMQGAPFKAPVTPQYMVFHPSGKYAYVTSWGEHTVTAYSVDPETGVFESAPVNTYKTGSYPFNLVMHSSGTYLYVGSWGDNALVGYRVDSGTGALSPLPGQVVTNPGYTPVALSIDPSKNWLYTTNYDSNDVSILQLNSTSGQLSPLGVAAARLGARSIALVAGQARVEASSKLALVTDAATDTLLSFAVDAQTGALKPLGRARTGARPSNVAIAARGDFAYVTNEASGNVSAYALTQNGTLAEVVGSPFATGKNPKSLALDQEGDALYVVNSGDNTMSVFFRENGSGALAAVRATSMIPASSPYPTVKQPVAVALSPTERYIYSVGADGGMIGAFSSYVPVGPLTIPFSPAEPAFDVGGHPIAMVIAPTGRFAFVLDRSGVLKTVHLHWSNAAFTENSGLRLKTSGKDPVALRLHQNGRILYVANSGSNDISTYRFDPETAILTEVLPRISAGKYPVSLALDGSGRHLYVVNQKDGTIGQYSIAPATGVLRFRAAVPAGDSPSAITLSVDYR